jgi:hypothetical protein
VAHALQSTNQPTSQPAIQLTNSQAAASGRGRNLSSLYELQQVL